MKTTTRSSIEPRGQNRSHRWVIAAALLVLALYVAGWVGVVAGPVAVELTVVGLLVGWLGFEAIRERRKGGSADLKETTMAAALAGVAAAFVASRWLGGVVGWEAYALVALAVAWVVSTSSVRTGALAVAVVLGVEGASHWLGTATAVSPGISPVESAAGINWELLAMRAAVVIGFAAVVWALVGRREHRRRKVWERQVDHERRQLLEEARQFRLIHAGRSESSLDRRDARELIVRDAVDAVQHTVFVTLQLVKTALRAHTVVLLWFDVRGDQLHIKELVSDSDDIVEAAIDPAEGIIGGITRQRDMVAVSELREDYRGLSYYRNSPKVTEFAGVPVIENGHLRGVLCVDRAADRPFDEEEKQIIGEAADYVLRIVENERMVASIEQTRFEVGRFYEASRRLNEVLTPRQVYQVALESVRQIAAYDFAAITTYDVETDHHQVAQVDGDAVDTDGQWQQVQFDSNQGLVSMVVRNRHYLPVGGRLRDPSTQVLTEDEDFSALESLLVLPLISQDQAVGTMIIGHRSGGEFPTQRREMLEVVANQVATALQNARMYDEMETMAKYDALTGLANRRRFETKLEEAMARHLRAGRPFGLVLTDIDHFKSVNDTYGHPVGDEVLETLGELFAEQMREVDVPARYGGEEFALILEDTDLEGARQVAERLRQAVADLEFQTDQGPLQCTISLGIAIGPWDSDDPHTLVDLADQALYHSKETGRDRVTVYREIESSSAA